MTLEGHDCWEGCDEGPHGCICGNDCEPPGGRGDPFPNTDDIRDALRPYRVHPAEFDRWLAAHDAEVRQEQADHDAVRIDDLTARLATAERILAEQGEPEWEYAIWTEQGEHAWPFGPQDEELATDYASCVRALDGNDPDFWEPGDYIVRRRKAGPWLPVEENGENDG